MLLTYNLYLGMIPVITEDILSDGSHARHAIDSVQSRRIVMSMVR